MNIKDKLRYALKHLRHRRLRTWLTVLSIVIGIVTIMLLIGLSEGLKANVDRQISQFDPRTVVVIPMNVEKGGATFLIGGTFRPTTGKLFEKDAEKIKGVEGVEVVAKIVMGRTYIEFKEKLSVETHLKEEKRQHLAAQMKYRLEIGKGKAIYIIGVDDYGRAKGLTDLELEETLNVLKLVAIENNAQIAKVEKFPENGKFIGRILITRESKPVKQHVIISTCGHVNHGKSTLVACLMTGKADKNGKAWLYLDVLPHEIERGLCLLYTSPSPRD